MSITASVARKNLFGLIEQVNDDRTEVEITSRRGTAVLVSRDESDALRETGYLLQSPANADRLQRARADARDGRIESHDLA